ncbi:MAG: VanZ family protein [Saprospiraceae bacterium]|jgi:VanZ family protein|nr:VanZ family protein [Saprospiraceae bacterium]
MQFKLLAITAISFFLFVISMVGLETPLGLYIKDLIASAPLGDKVIHFGMMLLLTLLLYHAMKPRKVNIFGHGVLFSSLVLAIGISLEELSQAFIPSRNFDIMDMVCNYAGIYIGGLVAKLPNLKQITDADHFGRETLSIQTIRHSTGPLHHESGHGRRAARRMVRHHGRR